MNEPIENGIIERWFDSNFFFTKPILLVTTAEFRIEDEAYQFILNEQEDFVCVLCVQSDSSQRKVKEVYVFFSHKVPCPL